MILLYIKMRHYRLKMKFILYAAGQKEYKNDIIGKQYVLHAYKNLRDDVKCSKFMNKYVFIVDYDYDGLLYIKNLHSKGYTFLDIKDRNNITVTKGYSFENYFLMEINLELIFENLLLSNKDYIKFNSMYREFVNETKEYFAYWGVQVYAVRENIYLRSIIKQEYKRKDIFNFDFSRSQYYNKDDMNNAIEKMKNSINCNKERKKLNKRYNEIKSLITYDSAFIQGHTAYDFLQKYLLYFHSINLEPRKYNNIYLEIIKKIDFPMEVRLGNGKKI